MKGEGCIESVREIFVRNDIAPLSVGLGRVVVDGSVHDIQLKKVNRALNEAGYEIIGSEKPLWVSNIKRSIEELFEEEFLPEDFVLSKYLTEHYPYDYSHISRMFSRYEEGTIENYFIGVRIEKAKELLLRKELQIREVAFRLGYASPAHFSRQFKKLVGRTPSASREG